MYLILFDKFLYNMTSYYGSFTTVGNKDCPKHIGNVNVKSYNFKIV